MSAFDVNSMHQAGDTLLEVKNLSKRYGGILASDNIGLSVRRGDIHAVIGPNGAGKTTLIAQLQGEVLPDSGSICFDGLDLIALPAHRRTNVGIARSFQITSLFLDMTVLENAALAMQGTTAHSFKFWHSASSDPALRAPAAEVVEKVGLVGRSNTVAAHLSHGQRRQLEMAMALISRPKLLLLNEPLAGMVGDESRHMVDLIKKLKREHTVLLIEHDVDAVFSIADRITVLVSGRSIMAGTPSEVRNSQEVRRAYLGDKS